MNSELYTSKKVILMAHMNYNSIKNHIEMKTVAYFWYKLSSNQDILESEESRLIIIPIQ